MARLPGRAGRLYLGIASGGTAEPVAFIKNFNVNQAVDKIDATAWGDTNKVAFSGWPDASGSFNGFLDDATQQIFTAASDGVARKLYFYANTLTNTPYWFTTAIVDGSMSFDINGMEEISGNWAAQSPFIRVP